VLVFYTLLTSTAISTSISTQEVDYVMRCQRPIFEVAVEIEVEVKSVSKTNG